MTHPMQATSLFSATLPLTFSDQGEGPAFLLLHSGAGAATIGGLADTLSGRGRAVVPTHPGFDGTPRPDWCARIGDLVLAYLALIERLDLSQVVLIGNSVGGWIAAEMALRGSPRVAGLVLLNSVGIETENPERPIVDPMTLPPRDLLAHSFHDPGRFASAPPTPEAAAVIAANQKTLRVYAGEPFMHDLSLRPRLARMPVPAMLIWGESDGIVDMAYGRHFADSISGAQFRPVPEAGHFPQIEQPARVAALIGELANAAQA